MRIKFTILVVDDDNDLREAIARLFLKKNFIVHQAASGQAAFEIIKSHPIDLVLSDVRMPNGTGVELLKWIRENHPEIPIVVLATGYTDLREGDMIQQGARAVINKPFDRKALLSTVETLLNELQQKAPRTA